MKKVNLSEIPSVARDGSTMMLMQEIIGKTAVINDTQLSIANFVMPSASFFPKHHHLASNEVFIVVNGNATLIINDDSYPICQGDVIMIEKGDVHQIVTAEDETIEFLAVNSPAFTPEDFIVENEE